MNFRLEHIGGTSEFCEDSIQSSIHYRAFKDFSGFKNIGLNAAPIAEDIATRELTLLLYPTMTLAEVDMVCDTLISAIN